MSKSSPLSTNQGVKRFAENPLLKPEDIKPSEKHLNVECLLNPGAFVYDDKIWLLLRVAEAAQQSEKYIRIPVFKNGNIEIMELDRNIPDIDASDPRVIIYEGKAYLTTLSHFRLAYSIDGKNFKVTDKYIIGHGELEAYGIEDCRVTQLEDTYFLTYTAVSECGYGVNMTSTTDWENFDRYGMIISGPNKDCAIFQEKIG